MQNKPFFPLEGFSTQKIVAFLFFCLLIFILLVCFDLIYVFVPSKIFRKKIETVPVTSFTILIATILFHFILKKLLLQLLQSQEQPRFMSNL